MSIKTQFGDKVGGSYNKIQGSISVEREGAVIGGYLGSPGATGEVLFLNVNGVCKNIYL